MKTKKVAEMLDKNASLFLKVAQTYQVSGVDVRKIITDNSFKSLNNLVAKKYPDGLPKKLRISAIASLKVVGGKYTGTVKFQGLFGSDQVEDPALSKAINDALSTTISAKVIDALNKDPSPKVDFTKTYDEVWESQ